MFNRRILVLFATVALCGPLTAVARDIVFTAPPRESIDDGKATYDPIAEYLSKVSGQTVRYEYSRNWLSYMSKLQEDYYDVVFDGPHFISWRMARYGHMPLVRIPGSLDFIVMVRADNANVTQLSDLAGRSACGHAPPNLATLTFQAQFPNPSRQPYLIELTGFPNIFQAVLDGKCDAGVVPSKIYAKLNKGDKQNTSRVIFQSKPLPNQGFSASTRVPPELQAKFVAALLAPEAEKPTAKLRARFAGGKAFIAANRQEFEGLGYLLKDMWGFELDPGTPAAATASPAKPR